VSESDFVDVILGGDVEAVAAFLSPLREKERRALASTAVALDRLERDIDAETLARMEPSLVPYADRIVPLWTDRPWRAIKLALLGTGTAAEAAKAPLSSFRSEHAEAVLRVLRERKPSWLQEWIETKNLRVTRDWMPPPWELLYRLIREGVCEKPTIDGYYHAMAVGVGAHAFTIKSDQPWPTISEYLRDHTDLLDDVWRLFELQTAGFLDEPGHAYILEPDVAWARENWGRAFHVLADEGIVERGRVIEACLTALQGNPKKNRVTCVMELHDKLAPTIDELEMHQHAYLGLLSVPAARTATFAFNGLAKLGKSKRLDDPAFVGCAAALLSRKPKGLVVKALKQFEVIAKRTPDLRSAILDAAAETALQHENTDVQARALDLLEMFSNDLGDGHIETIREHVEYIAPTLQQRARNLCGARGGEAPAVPAPPVAAAPVQVDIDVSSIPEHWRALAGVDGAMQAMKSDSMPPALDFDMLEVPLTTGLAPIPPMERAQEIIDILNQEVRSFVDNERLFHGISQLSADEVDNFDKQAAPILQRMKGQSAYIGLVRCWLTRGKTQVGVGKTEREQNKLPGLNRNRMPGLPIDDNYDQRLLEIGKRVAKGQRGPMLSMPTHQGAWILPEVLVARVNMLIRDGLAIPRYDLILALLRLAPDGRAAAGAALEAVNYPPVRALRWVLTGQGEAGPNDDPTLWLAAARSRAPHDVMNVPGIDPETVEGADGGYPTKFSFMSDEEREAFAVRWQEAAKIGKGIQERTKAAFKEHFKLQRMNMKYRKSAECLQNDLEAAVFGDETRLCTTPHGLLSHRLHIAVENGWSKTVDYMGRPTTQLHNLDYGVPEVSYLEFMPPILIRHGVVTWPLNSDPGVMAALVSITSKLEKKSPKNWPELHALEPLHEPDRPFSLLGATLLFTALSAPTGDLQRAGIDLMMTAVDDGRAHPATLAPTLVHLSTTNYLMLSRLATSLIEVARISPQHAWVCAELMDTLVAHWKEAPKDAHVVLDPLLEWKTLLGQGQSPAAGESLGQLKLTGKATKAAKQLMSLKEDPAGRWREARNLMLAARIARAERWTGG